MNKRHAEILIYQYKRKLQMPKFESPFQSASQEKKSQNADFSF